MIASVLRCWRLFVLALLPLVALGIFLPSLALAQTPLVEVVGLQRIDRSLISEQLRAFASSPTEPSELARAAASLVRSLYGTGFFADVQIYKKADGYLVVVRERLTVDQVKVEGADELEDKKVEEALLVHEGAFYDPADVVASIDALQKLYREEGMLEVEIVPVTEVVDASILLTLKVDEGNKVRIRSVRFQGNHFFTEEGLVNRIQTQSWGVLSFLSGSGKWDPGVAATDARRLAAIYEQRGFLKVEIGQPVATWSRDRRWVDVVYRIREGLQYRLGKVSFTGDLIFSRSMLRDLLPLEQGEEADRLAIEQTVQTWADEYSELGYAFARAMPRFDYNDSSKTVDITFDITPGKPVYFRLIEIRGNSKTRDKVIRREILIEEGELFSGRRLRQSRQRIFALGFFEDVSLSTRAYGPEQMDLIIQVREKATGTVSAGLGYSSIDAFVGNLKLNFGNLMGYGIRVDLNTEFGGRRQTFSFKYTDPYFLDTKASFGVDLFYNQQTYFLTGASEQTYDQLRIGGQLTIGYLVGLYTRLFGAYRNERITLDGTSFASNFFSQGGRTGAIQFTIRRDSKSHPYDPMSGSVNLLRYEIAESWLGGDYSFQKYTALTQWFYNPVWQIVFMLRGELGLATSPAAQRIPFSERYFLGGIYSLRGYDYRSVGPGRTYLVDSSKPGGPSQEIVIGGNKQFQGNAEITFPILPQAGIKGVLFFDAGNAWLEEEGWFSSELRYGYGWGFRWFSPMGPLRFEWGYPLFPRAGERTSVFEFTIGTYF